MHDQTLQEILDQARSVVQEIAIDEAYRLFKVGGKTAFVDMKEMGYRDVRTLAGGIEALEGKRASSTPGAAVLACDA